MDQLDLMDKTKLLSALRFTMKTTSDIEPSKAIYCDGGFHIQITYQHEEPIATISTPDKSESGRNKVDHSLSSQGTAFLKDQARVITIQNRLKSNMAKKA